MPAPGTIETEAQHLSRSSTFCPPGSISDALRLLTKMMKAKDPALVEHGRRTAEYAMAIGRTVGLPARDLIDLYYAALLHDIGKITLPDGLLQQTGPFSQEEYILMQCHPRDGARFLATISCLRRAAVLIAHHHEHWNGSGYPYGLRGTFIPLGSRILAVADRFDALCSEQKAFVDEDPVSRMKLLRTVAGSQLDPMLVGIFLERADGESRASVEDVGTHV